MCCAVPWRMHFLCQQVPAVANTASSITAALCSLPCPRVPPPLLLLQVMRGKIRGRVYVNWQELVRDFELICTNAMKYNQKRSRVHKQGLVMLRAGKKLLAEMEVEGRRAMAAMVAAGIAAAAAPASLQMTAADSQALPSSLYRSGEPAAVAAVAFLCYRPCCPEFLLPQPSVWLHCPTCMPTHSYIAGLPAVLSALLQAPRARRPWRACCAHSRQQTPPPPQRRQSLSRCR